MALLDKNQIMEIIPHRDPFLLIDEVEELEIGKRVVAKKFIAPDSFWFRGHFPEQDVYKRQGVLRRTMGRSLSLIRS